MRRLGERLSNVRWQEEQVRRRAAYEAARAEREELAKELAEVYPRASAQLADIAGLIAASDAMLEGFDSLAVTLQPARDLLGNTANIPRITAQLRLPAFRYSGNEPYAWPRSH